MGTCSTLQQDAAEHTVTPRDKDQLGTNRGTGNMTGDMLCSSQLSEPSCNSLIPVLKGHAHVNSQAWLEQLDPCVASGPLAEPQGKAYPPAAVCASSVHPAASATPAPAPQQTQAPTPCRLTSQSGGSAGAPRHVAQTLKIAKYPSYLELQAPTISRHCYGHQRLAAHKSRQA